jgi:hypothetical protein
MLYWAVFLLVAFTVGLQVLAGYEIHAQQARGDRRMKLRHRERPLEQ